jgi:hypothetical protein
VSAVEGTGPADRVALGVAVLMALFMLYLAGAPIHTDDLWFHLRMGEHFLTHGLHSGFDPTLHTAHPRDPVTHEWLFGVAVHLVDRSAGFLGLQVADVLATAVALALALSILRREAASPAALGLAATVFLSLSWWRYHQIRPDLVTIPFTFATYRLLLERAEPPPWSRVVAAAALAGVWANAHSGFLLGIALLGSGCLGYALRAVALAAWVRDAESARREWRVTRRLLAALGLAFAATLVNPRGIDQHLTFLRMRATAALPAQDDWPGFRPIDYVDFGGQLGRFEWVLTDALFASFLIAAARGGLRLLRRRSPAALDAADPVRFGLGLASAVAILLTVRTNWLCLFPLVFLLRAHRLGGAGPGRRAGSWALAGAAAAVAVGFFGTTRHRSFVEVDPRVWWTQRVSPAKYAEVEPGLRFLVESSVEGNLFSSYGTGAFLAYWLAPRVRSFIDGRNEAYPPEVFHDYAMITLQQGGRPGETYLDTLERRNVDLFFGTGYPFGQERGSLRPFTTSHVEGAPGWLAVYRSVGHAIHLRTNERNRENFERIAAYYAREEVPFDRARGFDVDAVIRERPDWAEAQQILPIGFAGLREAARAAPPEQRAALLQEIALYFALAGAWEHELEAENALLELLPRAIGARRRRIHALLRLGRVEEAQAEADELERRAPGDPDSMRFVRAAREIARRERDPAATALTLAGLPLVDPANGVRLLSGRYRPRSLDARSLRGAEREPQKRPSALSGSQASNRAPAGIWESSRKPGSDPGGGSMRSSRRGGVHRVECESAIG